MYSKHVMRLMLQALVTAFVLAAGVQSAAAQEPAHRTTETPPPRLTPAQMQILARIKQSGMSKEQLRQRLKQAGYDPNLADQYFDELSRPDTTEAKATAGSRYVKPLPAPSGSLISALQHIGVLTDADSIATSVRRVRPDTLRTNVRPTRTLAAEPQVFGSELFKASTQFEPVLQGPVDPGYRLGPGDELTLVVTGDVELAYDLTVTPEGYIIVPDVGQVIVNGLTMEQAKRRLNERLGRVYSGIQVGTTQADVTVGRVHSKLVYVIGDAEVPGAYPLSGSATVFSALYRAGGPSLTGSFRNIQVRHDNKVVQNVDLYDYLLRGDKSGDVTLEQGDVVFIPVVGPQVTVVGGVRRPAIFELKGSEGLADVMRFAGGAQADAAIERVQIDRILPASQRTPGHERVLVDVKLDDLMRGAIAMQDGDRVRVSRISDVRRNRVAISGDVQRPGDYEFRPGMTALDLINNAEGLLPSAYTPAGQVVRLNPADSSTSVLRIVLDDPNSPSYAGKVALSDLDEVSIFGRAALANPKRFEVFGYVKNEGTYNFSEGMTVKDAVLMAGGFKEGASEGTIEVARRVSAAGRDTLAVIYKVPFDLNASSRTKGSADQDFALAEGDQVFIRRAPGFQPLSTVEVTGEVVFPGEYTVRTRQEHVSELVARAGGLTKEAYPRGFRLFRDGKPVGVDFPKAMKNPRGPDDVAIEPGDRLEVPRYDPTVLVTGAVAFESRVHYEKGLSMDDYIARAGGVADNGNQRKAAVRYPNGELRTASGFLGFHRGPRVEPGSTITVPVRAEGVGFDWDKVVGRTLSVLSGLATIALTVKAIK